MAVKLIIWDLDDTLWRGTLADGEPVTPFPARVALIRAFNARGVVSAICSKNDFTTAQARLTELGLWDEFVFPQIAFEPKPQAIARIIADMQLRAVDVLFIDDNPLNLGEVRFLLPEIQCLDATAADADTVLAALLAAQTGTRSRVADYRVLETRRADRAMGLPLSDVEFLRSCEIRVCLPFCMETLDHVGRIAELINRSNQLNYTGSRVTVEELRETIIDVVRHASLAVFAWDRYGDYGLVGFVMLERDHDRAPFGVRHFVFSCRAMHMGLERYALDHLPVRGATLYPAIAEMAEPGFADRFDATPSDWIECRLIDDDESRSRLLADRMVAEPVLRIMANCQSGGLAHFSTLRAQILFDNFPNVFLLRSVLDDEFPSQPFPPYLVYAVGTEYANGPWGPLAQMLDTGLYALCARRLAAFVAERGIEMLVLLPPDDQPDGFYRPDIGMSAERTRAFNAIWRDIVTPGLSIGELGLLHGPDEMYDINHHRPESLQKVAGLIDLWHAQVSGEAPTMDRQAA
ncbi:HAD family hydrolase [Sphingomonas sp. CROZ-RG-20F-R02-07]|uniref:HAD family hydrolase n=1 Tax=Sphingomonas sp. CROZ-RG-20F-R02-07 TaxID=2914832 RepID=UPI001F55FB81|nr:HAD family hydrolase [Sphingomonas sp. CROZ-RG-20F-R02-07]